MSDGLIRPVDKMGRVVIPKEYREELGVENDVDSFEITKEGNKIILQKFNPRCIFCNRVAPSLEYNGYTVCKDCIEALYSVVEKIE